MEAVPAPPVLYGKPPELVVHKRQKLRTTPQNASKPAKTWVCARPHDGYAGTVGVRAAKRRREGYQRILASSSFLSRGARQQMPTARHPHREVLLYSAMR